jgi:hypothetical protein
MTTYSYGQLEGLWIAAGGSTATAPLAAALAEAESGGNPLAAYPGTTVAPGQGSTTNATGLWQILGLPSGNFTAAQLTDPLSNAKMAVAKYQQAGNSFSPWQTYTQGTYQVQSGVAPIPWTGASSSGDTILGIQGNVPGVNKTNYVPSGAVSITPGGQQQTPATPGSLGLPSILSGVGGLLYDVANALDYFFGMFGRGQGWRLVFSGVSIASLFLAYKALVGAGAIPSGLMPSVVPVPV